MKTTLHRRLLQLKGAYMTAPEPKATIIRMMIEETEKALGL